METKNTETVIRISEVEGVQVIKNESNNTYDFHVNMSSGKSYVLENLSQRESEQKKMRLVSTCENGSSIFYEI